MTPHDRFIAAMGRAFEGLWTERPLPASQLLGLRVLEMDPSTGDVAIAFQALPAFCNAMGIVQGGFVTAMLDDAMGISGTVRSGMTRLMLTHEIKVSFIAPARVGALVAHGRTLALGAAIAYLEARLEDGAGQLLAKASATARPVDGRVRT